MDPILETIDAALKRKNLSDSAASRLAVGHPSLIKNLRMPRAGEKRYNLPALQKLAEVLDLEFYFGPVRDQTVGESVVLDSEEYAHVPLHAASLSAGNGEINSEDVIVDHLAFKREWLRRIGVPPASAVLARVSHGERGESMSPTIAPGDMVLIDTSRRVVPSRAQLRASKRAPIYALNSAEGARVKRLSQVDNLIVLLSDNPEFPPEFLGKDRWSEIDIIGKVVWWGHTNTD